MAETTKNYKLNKPLINEKVNISIINQNMDVIDAELKKISDEKINNEIITNEQIDSLFK